MGNARLASTGPQRGAAALVSSPPGARRLHDEAWGKEARQRRQGLHQGRGPTLPPLACPVLQAARVL